MKKLNAYIFPHEGSSNLKSQYAPGDYFASSVKFKTGKAFREHLTAQYPGNVFKVSADMNVTANARKKNPVPADVEKVIVKKGDGGYDLYFPDAPASPGRIEVWDEVSGHGEAALSHFQNMKNPTRQDDDEVRRLIAKYEKHYDTKLTQVKRMQHTRAKNPASRIGTARPRRLSQVTRNPPTKRLVKRRKKNTDVGYFPNPVIDSVTQNADYEVYVYKSIKEAQNTKGTLKERQARLSYAQGLIIAGFRLKAFSRAEMELFMQQLKADGVIGK